MSAVSPLGIKRLEALHYYVRDLDRMRRFLVDELDFAELGGSDDTLDREGRQHAAVFAAGDITLIIHEPRGQGGRAHRYLRKHPEGVGTLVFEVEDIARTFRLLDERGGTFIDDIRRTAGEDGSYATFSITTPFGDTTFRFVERRGFRAPFPGFVPRSPERGPTGQNRFGFSAIDHVTSNFQTMKPALLWMEHVLGFQPFWQVTFHTMEVMGRRAEGSGLRSWVMRDPESGLKFANNEPFRPSFKASQINLFAEENRGDGVQHAALRVGDIVSAVRELRGRGVAFMPTPPSYYALLPERLARLGIARLDEPLEALEELQILVDGEQPGAYLLQIFLQEGARRTGDPEAGPFFFELIQRKGDEGFGAGNFRALFEAIERAQRGVADTASAARGGQGTAS